MPCIRLCCQYGAYTCRSPSQPPSPHTASASALHVCLTYEGKDSTKGPVSERHNCALLQPRSAVALQRDSVVPLPGCPPRRPHLHAPAANVTHRSFPPQCPKNCRSRLLKASLPCRLEGGSLHAGVPTLLAAWPLWRRPRYFLPALVKPRSSRCFCTGFTIQLMRASCVQRNAQKAQLRCAMGRHSRTVVRTRSWRSG